jgi:hypothetical protein
MAEQFIGHNHKFVAFSNSSVEDLLSAWIRIAKALSSNINEDQRAVITFLQSRLEEPMGCKAFELIPDLLPTEIDNPTRLSFLLKIIESFAKELAYNLPELATLDVNWNQERRLDWLSRVLALYGLVAECVTLKYHLEIPSIKLNLPRSAKESG